MGNAAGQPRRVLEIDDNRAIHDNFRKILCQAENMISVENLGKAYEHEIAVSDLSFAVEAGQVVGLVGPNGAGKTTTLRTLTGIIEPSSGRLVVAGFDVSEQPLWVKQHTAYVPDDPQLFGELTVWQHLEFVAAVYGRSDWQADAEHWLARFEIAGKKPSRANGLSRGMRQKLAICAAYLQLPQALLLDEPMTGLDPRGIRTLKQSIREHADRGVAVIVSSHLLQVIEEVCSHVVILNRGECSFFGSLQSLRGRFAAAGGNKSLEEIFFTTMGASAQ